MEENQLSAPRYVVVIGGSAGSLDVLLQVLPLLENIEKIAIVIVVHRKNSDDNILEELLRMKSGLHVKEIEDKTLLKAGRIHVAPADYHLLFEKDQSLALDVSEKVQYSRPSIDIAFESAAEAFGQKVIAVLLSGANSDGTDGLLAVKKLGGIVVIQSPVTADVPYMPAFALTHLVPDHVLAPIAIADFINGLNGGF
ncbi:MAG TPA: chemotaxis protein CheB [Flavobacterium sp.]|jgi:two-component system chemotaxis response regulator CheB|nr:chemotaxis protein CheB [Flavobacterium sp.]HPJ10410.1 chemotaxis protein CheB [Flavobacterium sp.]